MEVLATCMALGGGRAVAIAYLGGGPRETYEHWVPEELQSGC